MEELPSRSLAVSSIPEMQSQPGGEPNDLPAPRSSEVHGLEPPAAGALVTKSWCSSDNGTATSDPGEQTDSFPRPEAEMGGTPLGSSMSVANTATSTVLTPPSLALSALHSRCHKLGVSTQGTQADLISRVLIQQRLAPLSPGVAVAGTPDFGTPTQEQDGHDWHNLSKAVAPFASLRKCELEHACAKQGLSSHGTRTDLLGRLSSAAVALGGASAEKFTESSVGLTQLEDLDVTPEKTRPPPIQTSPAKRSRKRRRHSTEGYVAESTEVFGGVSDHALVLKALRASCRALGLPIGSSVSQLAEQVIAAAPPSPPSLRNVVYPSAETCARSRSRITSKSRPSAERVCGLGDGVVVPARAICGEGACGWVSPTGATKKEKARCLSHPSTRT